MKVILNYILFITAILSANSLFAQKSWTLKECIDQALGKNIQLSESQLTSKLNEINLAQAKANEYPNFSVTDGQSFTFHSNTSGQTGSQANYQNISANNAALNGSITLYNGFQLKNTIKQSKYLLDAGNFDVDKMKNDITLNIVAAYLQVLYSYKALDIANGEVKSDLTQVEKTQKFVDAGKLAEGSLLQVQSQLTADKATAVSADNQLQLAKVSLMQLMNMPIDDKFIVDSSGTKEPPVENVVSTADIYKTSEGIMPEIKSAELVTKADEISINIAHGLAYPKLTMGGALKTAYSSGSYLYTTTYSPGEIGYMESNPSEEILGAIPNTTKENYPFSKQFADNFTPAITLNLTIPIFNNYQAKYGIAKAKINLQNSQLEEQALKDQLRKNIEQAYTDLTAAVKEYAAAKDNLASEQRTYNDLEKKFNLGLATATDFLIEKNNFEKAKQSVVQAKYTYIFKSKIVDFYLGKPLN
ncbi:MAG: TolC family protein [Bacteroidales bacterium]|jgi:outer membrane protein